MISEPVNHASGAQFLHEGACGANQLRAGRPSALPVRGRRDPDDIPLRRLVIALSAFSALSAVGGGLELIVASRGNQYLPPLEVLRHTPFDSFVIPGLILAVVVGGASLFSAVLAWRRSLFAVDATILAGGSLLFWILAEVGMLRGVHWLHAVYGALGLAILSVGMRGAWKSSEDRHRWVARVTLAEGLGFLAPIGVGAAMARMGLVGGRWGWLVLGAGWIEGLALGVGQASAFPLPLRKMRYALLTASGAFVAWGAALFVVLLGDAGYAVPVVVLAGGVAAGVGLFGMGAAQWIELRHHSARARSWIAWTALAWVLALPFSFAPGPFVDEATPLRWQLLLWMTGGALMAYVMALVTWQGVRRVVASSSLRS